MTTSTSTLEIVAGRAQPLPWVRAVLVVDHRGVVLDVDVGERLLALALDPEALLLAEDEPELARLGHEDLTLGVADHVGHVEALHLAAQPGVDAEAARVRRLALAVDVVVGALVVARERVRLPAP